MILHTTFYLTAEPERIWIGVNPETVSLDANNIQSTPLDIRIWTGEGSNKSEYKAYVTLRVESVVNEHVTILYEERPESKIFAWEYTIPEDKYPTANRVSIYAYEDEARTKEIAAKQVNIVAANPTPFPRPEEWAAGLVYKNGEYLIFGDMVYMWCSRVPGNTSVDPKTWMQNNPNSGLWKSYTEYAVLATKVFMAKFGLLGQAVFKDEYMISQQGVNSAGNITFDYRKFGTSAFIPNIQLNFKTGKAILDDAEIKGKITATEGSFSGEIIAERGKIGGFSLENGSLYWKGYDYFLRDSRSVRIGVPVDFESGMIDVLFNSATESKFGVKIIGANRGGACIYASINNSEESRSYPHEAHTYAGYFDGSVFVKETLSSNLCIADNFGVIKSRNADGSITYNRGVDHDFGTMRFRKGLLINTQ